MSRSEDTLPFFGDGEKETAIGASIKKAIAPGIWTVPPILVGLCFFAIGCSPDWTVAVVGNVFSVTIERVIFMIFGVVFILPLGALPYLMIRIASSPTFGSMYQRCCSADERFEKEFEDKINSLGWERVQVVAVGVFAYGLFAWFAFRTMYSIIIFSAVALSGAPGRSATLCIDWMLTLSSKSIDNVICEMIQDKSLLEKDVDDPSAVACFERSIDWESIASKHYALDLCLERLWAPTLGGALLGHVIAYRAALGGFSLVIGVIADYVWLKVAAFLIGAWFVLRVPILLQGPADLTTRCSSSSPRFGLKAIKVVVNGFSCKTKSREDIAQLKFLQYLNSTTTGIELFGVMVTPALIVHMMIGFATNLPVAVGILQGLVSRRV